VMDALWNYRIICILYTFSSCYSHDFHSWVLNGINKKVEESTLRVFGPFESYEIVKMFREWFSFLLQQNQISVSL
jgi:hypothetical protein